MNPITLFTARMPADQNANKNENFINLLILMVSAVSLVTIYKIINKIKQHRQKVLERAFENWTPEMNELAYFDQKKVGPYDQHPVNIAIKVNNYALTQLLLERFSGVGSQQNSNGWSPLHFAAAYGSLDLVRMVARKSPIFLTQNAFGNSALHFAAIRKDYPILNYLVKEFEADQILKNSVGENYLHVLSLETFLATNPYRILSSDKRYESFIEANRDIMPIELFDGLLTPYRYGNRLALTLNV